jgi:hypothetical protein
MIALPLGAADLKHKRVNKTDQVQTVGDQIDVKGQTQVPNKVTSKEKLSSTGHKHDGQGSEDLYHPRPLDAKAADSIQSGTMNSGKKLVQPPQKR